MGFDGVMLIFDEAYIFHHILLRMLILVNAKTNGGWLIGRHVVVRRSLTLSGIMLHKPNGCLRVLTTVCVQVNTRKR